MEFFGPHTYVWTKTSSMQPVTGTLINYLYHFPIIFHTGPQLKAVATMSAGYNHIDVDELKKRGIKLGNTPKVVDDSVADVAVLLTLAAARRFYEAQQIIET